MASITVNPDPGSGATTVDGRLTFEDTTWAAVHDATSTTDINVTETTQGIRAYKVAVNDWFIYRVVMTFDTSAIGSGSSITAATLSFYDNSAVQAVVNTDSSACQVVSASPASNNNLVGGDYNKNNFGTTVFGSVNLASILTNQYNDITLDSNGIANISKTGVSKFGLRNSRDVSNSAPTGDNFNYIFFADNGSNKPKLTVTYTTAGGTLVTRKILMGVGI